MALQRQVAALKRIVLTEDTAHVRDQIATIVPKYRPTPNGHQHRHGTITEQQVVAPFPGRVETEGVALLRAVSRQRRVQTI